MNIDEIENNLNNYQTNPDRAIALILQNVAKNQALLQTIVGLQINLIAILSSTDRKTVSKDVQQILNDHLLTIQAEIAKHF